MIHKNIENLVLLYRPHPNLSKLDCTSPEHIRKDKDNTAAQRGRSATRTHTKNGKNRNRSRSKSTPRKMSKSDQNENNETTTEIETLEIHPSPWSSLNEPKPEYDYDYNDFFKNVIDKFLFTDENKQKEILQNLDLKTTEELIDWLNQNPFNISALNIQLNEKPEESSIETEIIPEIKKSDDLRLPESHTQKKTTSQKEQKETSTKKRHEQQETKEQQYKRLQKEAIETYIETRLQGQDVFSTRRGLSNEKKLNTLYQKYDDFDDFIKTHYSELADNIKQSVLRENEQNRQRIIT